jgi:hypothetical protein
MRKKKKKKNVISHLRHKDRARCFLSRILITYSLLSIHSTEYSVLPSPHCGEGKVGVFLLSIYVHSYL